MQANTNTDVPHEDDRLHEVVRALALGVHAHRLQFGMTVTALAFESGLSESTIRAVEAGRVCASLTTLVAIADGLGVGVADLFGDAVEGHIDPATAAPDATDPAHSPYVVPSEVVWGGELPPAPWASAGNDVGADAAPEPVPAPGRVPAPAPAPTEKTWGGELPPAPWIADDAAAPSNVLPPEDTASSAAVVSHTVPRVHGRAAAHGMREASPYVLVAPDAVPAVTTPATPRTFSDLRTGALADRTFSSLREFAVVAVIEGGHPVSAVARVFRVPSWRLEDWVSEARGRVG